MSISFVNTQHLNHHHSYKDNDISYTCTFFDHGGIGYTRDPCYIQSVSGGKAVRLGHFATVKRFQPCILYFKLAWRERKHHVMSVRAGGGREKGRRRCEMNESVCCLLYEEKGKRGIQSMSIVCFLFFYQCVSRFFLYTVHDYFYRQMFPF